MADPRDFATLSRLVNGYATAQIVFAAVRLGLPDALAAGPMTWEQAARAAGGDPDSAARLLRALIVLRVVDEVAPGKVALSAIGAPLSAGHPRSIRSSVLLAGNPDVWRAWGALADGVRTGGSAFEHVHGRPLFDHLALDPELSETFNSAMSEGTTGPVAAAVARTSGVGGAGTIVDIGGGRGTLIAALLTQAPDARGILFDSAEGAAQADETLRAAGVSERCSIRTGDFFKAVPEGDAMFLKGILHDWDDERCVAILRHCRASIADGGSLYVVEPVMPDRLDAPDALGAVMSDISMLVYTGGRERTREQFRDVLAASGFELADVSAPLDGGGVRVLAARPV